MNNLYLVVYLTKHGWSASYYPPRHYLVVAANADVARNAVMAATLIGNEPGYRFHFAAALPATPDPTMASGKVISI